MFEGTKKYIENPGVCSTYKVPPSVTEKNTAYKFILLKCFCYCNNLKLFLMNAKENKIEKLNFLKMICKL